MRLKFQNGMAMKLKVAQLDCGNFGGVCPTISRAEKIYRKREVSPAGC